MTVKLEASTALSRIVFVHGSGAPDPGFTWGAQGQLSEIGEVVVAHRAGYGDNARLPPAGIGGDAASLVPTLGESAHVVGASSGALVALYLAALAPSRVKSLVLVEPVALSLVRGNPAAEELITSWSMLYSDRDNLTPESFFRGLVRMIGGPMIPEGFRLPSQARSAAKTAMREEPPWTVPVPLLAVVNAGVPMLVVTGGWHAAFEAVADHLGRTAGARRVVFAGAGHEVQRIGQPFNRMMSEFFRVVEGRWAGRCG